MSLPATATGHGELPPVSIVVTCFNQAEFLGAAIESALAQSHPRFEVLVVDDGSSDETESVAARYPVRYVWQRNGGLAAARNAGIATTEASFLVFLDADDRLLPGALAAGLACHRENDGCAIVYGGYVYIDAAGRRIAAPVRRGPVADPYAALLRKNHIGMHATIMYRRAALLQVGGFDPSLPAAEDHDMSLKLARRQRIGWHDSLVAEYRRHGTNMSNDHARILAGTLAVLRRHEAHARARRDHLRALRAGARFAIAKSGQATLAVGLAAATRGRLGVASGAFFSALRLVPPWLAASTQVGLAVSRPSHDPKAEPA